MPPLSCRPLRKLLHSTFIMPNSRLLLPKLSCRNPAVIPFFSVHLPSRQVLLENLLRNTSRFISFSLNPPGFRSFSALSSSGTVLLDLKEGEELTGESLRQLMEKLEEVGIKFDRYKTGQYMRGLCPQCDGGDSKERSFALFIREDGKLATWSCFRAKCGWRGSAKAFDNGEGYSVAQSFGSRPSGGALKCKKHRTISDEDLHLEPLCPEIKAYFNARSISDKTLQRNSVMQRTWDDEIVIAFTYKRSGKFVSCNYLDIDKRFWQEKDTESIFYGFDDIVPGNEIIIVDNEFDKLSMEEAGHRNCVSVPNRKASKVSEKLPKKDEDGSFQYLWTCKDILEKAPRVILATSADGPGQALAEELARRLGKERCWRVVWPMKSATEACKDANEVLNIFGECALKEALEKAEMFPIRGLFKFSNFFSEITDYYNCIQGFELGVSTGWRALDEFYNVRKRTQVPSLFRSHAAQRNREDARRTSFLCFSCRCTACPLFLQQGAAAPRSKQLMSSSPSGSFEQLPLKIQIVPGELSVITGIPNSGKSEWIDALLCNINEKRGWTFALCSMENKVQEHARKLLEKHIKKPFFNFRYGESVERMSLLELEKGKQWLSDTFHLIRCDDDSITSINWVLMLAKAAVLRHGVRGLVIDPYNELDHQRPIHQTETEYVSLMLTKLKRFAQHYSCHVWFVAHPRQLQNWGCNPPNLYDISGSAHFINKCDNGIVIHRDGDENGSLGRVQVCVRKVRNKVVGGIGDALLSYDRVTGLFHDIDNP